MSDTPTPDTPPAKKPPAIGAGTSVSVGVLTAYFTVPYLPMPFEPEQLTSAAVVHGLIMALVAGVIAAGARGAEELIERFKPGAKK